MKVTDLELRSHSEHKLCPPPPTNSHQRGSGKVSFTGSLALWIWSPAGLSQAGVDFTALPWICGSGKNVPKHTTPALGTHLRSAKSCKLRRRDSKKEITALPLSARGSHRSSNKSPPLKEERRGRKQAKERKEGRGERGRDGGRAKQREEGREGAGRERESTAGRQAI